ncbi:tRNA1(Val) (adenine(37)-N6)-methyltransferase [Alkaliphilus serpentinus]|uniref:tRNA1(Val) (Adenine(37)-N6)-methyltransferase n=1 Tax=Alkaliphilus serpentinus TaxID=1482731 RepID=A0A833HQE9_9FIRM|nr:tRNA1(Val) (adenine(37)-N6)-methyltransferase [Alkaliphilus serpentinus]KAB3531814.1 tRNA1(Val) (adenine(37)-N6)-methyltransferase [Alkaliphilus serpentinus]
MEKLLRAEERIDNLNVKDLRIIQNPKGFCFGIDAVLLANFVEVKKNSKVVDLGTGTGIIPLLLAGKSRSSHITGLEIQEEVADMAKRSVELNQLQQRIHILNIDLKDAEKNIPINAYDVVTSNPPYMHSEGLINPEDRKAISRHEIKCNLEDIIRIASRLLKHHGRFFMVHRPQRLVDIMVLCRKYKLEPKRLQFIHPTSGKKPNLLLIDCKKAANPELKILDPLIVYDDAGKYTENLIEVYNKTSIEEGSGLIG